MLFHSGEVANNFQKMTRETGRITSVITCNVFVQQSVLLLSKMSQDSLC